ncbi:hypothetical protein HKX48_000415 [Thoreauomyces humboldtii]|nr:hypothetical protein HKX48_000415 [Thoreauomyces humboldtii]
MPQTLPLSASLSSLPRECAVSICILLEARDLARLGACSRKLLQTTSDDLLWIDLCKRDYGVDAKKCMAAFPFITVKGFYCGVLEAWGWTLGAWQANYPFFTGQLLSVRVDTAASRIIAEKMTVINTFEETPGASEMEEDLVGASEFGSLPGVSVDTLCARLLRQPVFEIRFETTAESQASFRGLQWRESYLNANVCPRHLDPGETEEGSDDGEMGMDIDEPQDEDDGEGFFSAGPSFAEGYTPEVEGDSLQIKTYLPEGVGSMAMCCGAKLGGKPMPEHLGGLVDAWDTFSEYQNSVQHFPAFRPSPETGLWPYPESSRVLHTEGVLITMFDSNEPPLAFNRDDSEALRQQRPLADKMHPQRSRKASLMALNCRAKCHHYGVRTVTLRAPEGELRFRTGRHQTIWSKIRSDPRARPTVRLPPGFGVRPLEGIWAGTYGSHGIEFLLLRYEPSKAAPPPYVPFSVYMEPEDPPLDMMFYKVTGDVNVPRGEVSCRASLHDGKGNAFVRTYSVDEEEATEGTDDGEDPPGQVLSEHHGLDLAHGRFASEFRSARVFPGFGTIAMSGYRSPQEITNDVIVISETEVAVYWHDMRKVSRFTKVDL